VNWSRNVTFQDLKIWHLLAISGLGVYFLYAFYLVLSVTSHPIALALLVRALWVLIFFEVCKVTIEIFHRIAIASGGSEYLAVRIKQASEISSRGPFWLISLALAVLFSLVGLFW